MQTGNINTMATGRVTKKVLEDIEKLKDANRDIKYNGNGKSN